MYYVTCNINVYYMYVHVSRRYLVIYYLYLVVYELRFVHTPTL